jgi:mxaJ protein
MRIFMSRSFAGLAVAGLLCAVLMASTSAQSVQPAGTLKTLRVCGDPDNLPFSNQKLEGFENKIAAVIAADLKTTPSYFWWPHQRGLVKNTFEAGECDVMIGIPTGYDLAMWTKPYYRSSYVLAYRKDRNYKITSLESPDLQRLKIGVHSGTPAEEGLARRGIRDNLTTYNFFFTANSDQDHPTKLITDLIDGKIDVAAAWGPLAGYFAAKLGAPIVVVPLEGDARLPMSYNISMGVKKGDQALKAQLEGVIDRRQAEIRQILTEYGVPLSAQQAAPAGDPPSPAPAPAGAQAANSADAMTNPFKDNPDAPKEGRALYFKNGCSGCHGGGGGGGMAPSVIDENWKFGSKDDMVFKLITGQITEQTMPKVYSDLPADDVWKMISFIRSVYLGDPSKVDW